MRSYYFENVVHPDGVYDKILAPIHFSVVSINTATKEELMTLSGIGEAKAKEIITYREANGPFTAIEDIMKVNGIGEKAFAQIKEDVTL